MIKGKQPEEIRKLWVISLFLPSQYRDWIIESRFYSFNIENDFTPEEEAQIKKENEWAEDRVRPPFLSPFSLLSILTLVFCPK